MEREEFEERWSDAFDAIYSREPATGRPFKDSTWAVLPLGMSPTLRRSDFDTLDAILGPVSGGRVLITQEFVGPEREAPIELPWSQASLSTELAGTLFPHLDDFRVTPISGAWAWCCSNEDLSLLGGAPDLIGALVAALGGEEEARRAFQSAITKWVAPEFASALGRQRSWQIE